MDSPHLDRALRIKNNSVRGGFVEHVYMRDVTVGQVAEAVADRRSLLRGRRHRQVPAGGARHRDAQRHQPEERVRVPAPWLRPAPRSPTSAYSTARSTTSPSPTSPRRSRGCGCRTSGSTARSGPRPSIDERGRAVARRGPQVVKPLSSRRCHRRSRAGVL